MKTIYAIASGSYSDYCVHFLCLSEDLAKEVLARYKMANRPWNPDADIEEFQLVESLKDVISYTWYRVEVDMGTGRELKRWSNTQDFELGEPPADSAHLLGNNVFGRVQGFSLRGYDQALKSAYDHRAELLAKEAGLA